MSYKILEENITLLEDKAYDPINVSGIKLSGTASLLLDEKKVVKKILMQKNPQLTDEEATFIVDSVFSADDLIKKETEKSEKLEDKKSDRAQKKKLSEAEKAKLRAEAKARKEAKKKEIKEKIRIYKETYAAKLQALIDEAKQVLKDVKAAILRLIKDVKDISKKFITSTIKTFSSIPGILLTITAPPWNIPNAITITMVIVETYLDLLNMVKSVVPFLDPIRKLPLVTDKKNLSTLSSILNIPITILLALWAPIDAIGQSIQKFIDTILGFLKSKRNSIFRKATRQLKKLGHIPRSFYLPGVERKNLPVDDDPNVRVWAIDEDNVSDIYDILQTFRLSGNQYNPGTNDRVIAYASATNDDLQSKLTELNEQLKDDRNILPIPDTQKITGDTATPSFDSTVFDVELPDGSYLYGITQEQLEDLKVSYNVVIRELEALDKQIASKDVQDAIAKFNKFNRSASTSNAFADSIALTNSDLISAGSISGIIQQVRSVVPSITLSGQDGQQVSAVFTSAISSPVFTIPSSGFGIMSPTIAITTSFTSTPIIRFEKPDFETALKQGLRTTKVATYASSYQVRLIITNIASSEQIKVSQDGRELKVDISFSPSTGLAGFRIRGTQGSINTIQISATNNVGTRATSFTIEYLAKGDSKPSDALLI